jgi:hypothetical protein
MLIALPNLDGSLPALYLCLLKERILCVAQRNRKDVAIFEKNFPDSIDVIQN